METVDDKRIFSATFHQFHEKQANILELKQTFQKFAYSTTKMFTDNFETSILQRARGN